MLLRMQELISKGTKLPLHATVEVDKLLEGNKDVQKASPLVVELEAQAEADVVRVEGKLHVDLELACSRCLEPAHAHLDIPFFERFKQGVSDGDEDEADDIIMSKEDKINLQPYVEESLLLYVPFVPLCSEQCRGLCPKCGVNLNESQCDCSREVIDPRFAALKDLFKS
ncbi:DUF177 domain-containing protein [Paenibacillaceae bacterium]|nr:DUF177 domain-containing protein [Paenibacillaceae bacterium]